MATIPPAPVAEAAAPPPDERCAIDAIHELKARYFRLMDTRDWDGWRKLYTADAVMDMRGEADSMRSLGFVIPDGDFLWRGAACITEAVSQALNGVVTVHHGHMGEIRIVSETTASGIWAMEDVIRYGADAPIAGFHGYGHYHDTYRVEDGAWRIASTRLTRLLVTPVPHRAGAAPALV